MERARRALLLAGVAAAALAFFHADFSPLLRLGPASDRDVARLEPFVPPPGDGDALLSRVAAASAGTGPDAWRRAPDGYGPQRPVFFRPDEADVAALAAALPRTPGDRLIAAGPGRAAMRIGWWLADADDLTLGAGLAGVEPPARFYRPARRFAPWLLLAGVLLYAFLPRARRNPEVLVWSRPRIVLGDLLGAGLFALFFALPLAIVGAVAPALTTFAVLTAILWGLALFGLWIVAAGARAAGFGVRIEAHGIAIRTDGPFELQRFVDLESYAPATLRPPRWFRGLLALAAFSGRGGASGAAALAATSATHGIVLRRRDGGEIRLWLGRTGGGVGIPGAERIPAALSAAGVRRGEPVERIGFSHRVRVRPVSSGEGARTPAA